jgi:hypothetical protein
MIFEQKLTTETGKLVMRLALRSNTRMDRRNYLFSTYDLSSVFPAQEKNAKEAVERIDSSAFLNMNEEKLCDDIEQEFRIEVPVLKDENIELDQREAKVDVRNDPMRLIFDRSQPFYMTGTEISFFVPFEGDRNLFSFRPNSFSLNPPNAQVDAAQLTFTYTRLDHNGEAVQRDFQRDLTAVQTHLQTQRSQVKQFNDALRSKIRANIVARRDRLLKSQGMAATLGYRMRKRPAAATTYVAPTIRKKPAVARIASSSEPFKPEPILETAEYEHILSVVSNMVQVIERSPGAFKGMKEEDLRQHFLVQLNGQYEGQATGETFNFEGKTDILIRVDGKNIFIAECKFWGGPESFKGAVDQLLGYATWRDSKTALLIFNRDRNLTTVLTKIPELMKAHPNFRRQIDYNAETGFRFALHHRDDESRELILTVLVFEVPA